MLRRLLLVDELREGHVSVLLLPTEAFDAPVAVVTLDATPERVQGQIFHRLCEHEFRLST